MKLFRRFYTTIVLFVVLTFLFTFFNSDLLVANSSSTAGTIKGSFNVDSNGQAVYKLPIPVPPGVRGLAPQLSLVYRSSGKNGVVGVGWQLSGITSITRIRATPATDGFPGDNH